MNTAAALSVRAVLAGGWSDFRRAWAPLVTFAVAFKFASAFALAPALTWLLARLVATTGHTAVSNVAIVRFLASPAGAAVAFIIGIELLGLELLSQAGILALARLKLTEPGATFRHAATAVLSASGRVFRLGSLQLTALVLVASPFVVLGALAYLAFLSGSDINYYLADKPPAFYAALTCAGILLVLVSLVGLWLYVRWSLALPILMFEAKSAFGALRTSVFRVRGHSWRIGGLLLGWHLLGVALGAIVLVVHRWLAGNLLDTAANDPAVLLPLTVALAALHGLVAGAIACAIVIGHGLLLLRFYLATGGTLPIVEPPANLAIGRGLIRANIAAFLVFAGFAAFASLTVVQSADTRETIEVTGHRGYERVAPENTLASFRAAIEAGVDWIELDVQLSSDGAIVVLHDRDFRRVAHDPRRPGQMTLAEIKTLDASEPWKFGPRYRGERIATLPEVIELARGRVHVNIELKVYGNDRRIAAAVADFVRREHFENQCLVASLDVEAVRQAKRHNPNLTTAAIVTVAVGNIAKLDVDVLSLNKKLVTVELLRQARDFGKGVLVWTVNDSREMQSLIEIGAGRLITNDPPALVRLRKERADLGPSGRILQAMRYWLGVKPKLPEDEGELRP